jgi:hypothetical protein
MILYTMMPQEMIYPTSEEEYGRQLLISYQGVPLLVEPTTDRSYQVIRIVSTDPQHFLNETLLPGTKISY